MLRSDCVGSFELDRSRLINRTLRNRNQFFEIAEVLCCLRGWERHLMVIVYEAIGVIREQSVENGVLLVVLDAQLTRPAKGLQGMSTKVAEVGNGCRD
jgi:hypothetical protein